MGKKRLPKKPQASNKDLVPGNKQSLKAEQGLTPLEMALEDPTLEKEVLRAFYTEAIPMSIASLGTSREPESGGKGFYTIMKIVRNTLMDENSQADMINKILAETIAGAYQDRVIAYAWSENTKSSEAIQRTQQMRQSADNHLLRVIQALRDFKRPPVSVTVRKTDQVNIADKQINVSQTKGSPSDLDKKNEKTG